MKKALIGIIVLVLLVGGGYALFHKPNKPAPSSASTTKQSNAPAANAVIVTKTSASLGQYLAAPNGRALYTYNADSAGISNCTGSCLANWPAYVATSSTTSLPAGVSTIKRADNGQTQYTYNGLPLYYFAGDSSGKVTGNGVNNFSVAKPAAAPSSSSSTPAPSPSQPSSSPSSSPSYPY